MSMTQQVAELLKPDNQDRDDYSGVWYGTVCPDGPAHPLPTDFNKPMYVVLPDFSPTHFWGPAIWQSRDAITLPEEGNICAVMFDNRRNVWVVAWWPF
jgi:hypothetical protein